MIAVNKQNLLQGTDQVMQIYFLLEESKFEAYADVAATKYHEEEARKEAEWKAKQEQREKEYKQHELSHKGDRGGGDRNKRGPKNRQGHRD